MSNRLLFIACVVFAAINIVAFLVNLYVVFYDTPDGMTYPSLYVINPISAALAIAGAFYFKRQPK